MAGRITIDNLSKSLKEYLNDLGLTEEQVNQIVNDALVSINEKDVEQDIELTNIVNKIGDLNELDTVDKSTIVNAINEVFQDASSVKQIIANAIGDSSISIESTFNAMKQAIEGLLNRRIEIESEIDVYLLLRSRRKDRLNSLMVDGGYDVTGNEDLTGLIDILEENGM